MQIISLNFDSGLLVLQIPKLAFYRFTLVDANFLFLVISINSFDTKINLLLSVRVQFSLEGEDDIHDKRISSH